ncbi:hypothetical protein TNCV_738851 [Trichonephila clavipes]|nr:hypothetical protein TNCV_738851 [Trichonephila clavipes]
MFIVIYSNRAVKPFEAISLGDLVSLLALGSITNTHQWKPSWVSLSSCVAAAAALEIERRLWIAQRDHASHYSVVSPGDEGYFSRSLCFGREPGCFGKPPYVSDTVLSPPNSDKYHTLSQRLITQLG